MIDFNKWDQHPRQTKCAEEADQLEWFTYQSGPSPVDASQRDDEVVGLLDEVQSDSEEADIFQPSANNAVQESVQNNLRTSTAERVRSERKSEELTAGILAEVERRHTIMGEHYPFILNAGSLRYRGTGTRAHNVYLECLRTSVRPTDQDREDFEGLVVQALGAYLGGTASSQLFGWQTLTESDRPRRIKAMVEQLHAQTGEWLWSPEANLPDDPSSQLIRDMGIDVVAWLPMPDGRLGKIMLLAQCATGKGDWENKLNDVTWDRIENWIRPTPHRWTIRCFAVPFHLPNEMKWRLTSKLGGLFFDRARLALVLRESQPAVLPPQQTAVGEPRSQSPEIALQPS